MIDISGDLVSWATVSSGASGSRNGLDLPYGQPLYIRYQKQNWVKLWSAPACAEFTVVQL